MSGPLDGIRILEFSEIIAAPFGGMLLADMGADIIKVEPPWGDPWRFAQEFIPFESRTYISLNRGKRSLPLDMTKQEAREIVRKLIPQMDVVILNNRPDVPHKLGIDYETLSAQNPRLIYCEITAFGRQGPDRQRPGYDLIVQAMSGLMASNGKTVDGVPQQITATAMSDFATGIAAAWSICAALYARERTGQGQKIESTLLGTALGIQTSRFLQVRMVDHEPLSAFLEELSRMRAKGSSYLEIQEQYESYRMKPTWNAYYRTYQTKDSVLAVGCLSEPLRKKMADVLGVHDIRFDPGYSPNSPEAVAFNEQLIKKLAMLFLEKTTAEWLSILDAAGVPAGPVRFTEELFDDPQVMANNLVVELEHAQAGPLKMVGPLVKMSQTPLETKSASPALGQHTAEILTALGYSAEDVQRLRESGVTR